MGSSKPSKVTKKKVTKKKVAKKPVKTVRYKTREEGRSQVRGGKL